MAGGVECERGNAATPSSQESPPSLAYPLRLTTARTRCVSQTIIEVEAKSLDDSTSWAIGQARLPDTSRGPAVEEENVPEVTIVVDGMLSQQGLTENMARTVGVANGERGTI